MLFLPRKITFLLKLHENYWDLMSWAVCDPESRMMVGIACCKHFPARPWGRADKKQHCQILFLSFVLLGFSLPPSLFLPLSFCFILFWFVFRFSILVGVFRTASCCMFCLSVLLGGPAWLAKCPMADVSVQLTGLACCSCCKVTCKISTLPWARLISWYWCSYCISLLQPLANIAVVTLTSFYCPGWSQLVQFCITGGV